MTTDDNTKRLTPEEADTLRKSIEQVEREEAAALAAEEKPDKA